LCQLPVSPTLSMRTWRFACPSSETNYYVHNLTWFFRFLTHDLSFLWCACKTFSEATDWRKTLQPLQKNSKGNIYWPHLTCLWSNSGWHSKAARAWNTQRVTDWRVPGQLSRSVQYHDPPLPVVTFENTIDRNSVCISSSLLLCSRFWENCGNHL
jgi:hypothetical protein